MDSLIIINKKYDKRLTYNKKGVNSRLCHLKEEFYLTS